MKRLLTILLMICVLSILSAAADEAELCAECGDTAGDMLLISSTDDSHTLECFCGDHFTLPHTWLAWQSNGDGTHTRSCTAGCVQTAPCSGGTANCTVYATCTECGGPHGSLDEDAHTWDSGTVTVAPTCRSLGAMTYTCLHNPDHTYTDPIDIDPDAHFFREGVVIVPATCTHEGVMKYTCLYSAQHAKEVPIPIDENGHRWDNGVVLHEADCTTPGETLYTCLDDPSHTRTVTTPVDLSLHVWSERYVSRQPTCTHSGLITLVCARDPSHTGSETIPATGHSWNVAIVTKEPTCTEPGTLTYTCMNDPSHTYTESIPATGHRWGNMQVIQEPTCIEEGVKSYICGYDIDHTMTSRIAVDPNAHDYQPTGETVSLPGVCTPGQAEIVRCTLCGNESSVTIVEPMNHTYSVWSSSNGSHHAVCDVCGQAPVSVLCHDTIADPCPICLDPTTKLGHMGVVTLTDADNEGEFHAVASAGGGLIRIGFYDEANGSLTPADVDDPYYVHLTAEQLAQGLEGSNDALAQRAYDILTSENLRIYRHEDHVMIRGNGDKLLLHVMYHAPGQQSDELFCHIDSNTIAFRVRSAQWSGHELTIWLNPEEP